MQTEEQKRFISQLYDEYYHVLNRYCISHLGYDPALRNEVQDCVQSVFEIAVKNYNKLCACENKAGWLMRVCQNVVMDAKRKQGKTKKNVPISADAPEFPAYTLMRTADCFDRWIETLEASEQLELILKSLSEDEAKIVDECIIKGKSASQVTQELGVTIGKTKGTLYRMRKRLRAEQEKYSENL